MSKPFAFTALPGIDAATIKHPRTPGWHKRAQSAAKRASYTARTTAPQHGTREADAKAVQYAVWLAKRDGLTVSANDAGHVQWDACVAGMRPRSVTFAPRGASPVRVDLPHWSYVTPQAVECPLADWVAPVASEVTGEARAEILARVAAEDVAAWCEAVADGYGAPGAWTVDGTDPEPAPAPAAAAPAPAPAPIAEPVAPHAVSTFAPSIEAEEMNTPPGEDIDTRTPGEAIGDAWGPTDHTHPIVALCLSDEARAALLARVMDGTAPADGRKARGGAWRVSLADARDLQGIASIRWVGMPRKVTTRRHLPPLAATPREAIRPHTPGEAISTPHAAFIPGAGRAPSPVTFHAAP